MSIKVEDRISTLEVVPGEFIVQTNKYLNKRFA